MEICINISSGFPRLAFDAYQTYDNTLKYYEKHSNVPLDCCYPHPKRDGRSSRNAQRVGWKEGINHKKNK